MSRTVEAISNVDILYAQAKSSRPSQVVVASKIVIQLHPLSNQAEPGNNAASVRTHLRLAQCP